MIKIQWIFYNKMWW